MGTTMGTGNVHNDDVETLQFADESIGEYEGADDADEVELALEQFAQAALDHDRNPNEADFIRWLVTERRNLQGKVWKVEALAKRGLVDRRTAELIRSLLAD
jgi:hypothetical protein